MPITPEKAIQNLPHTLDTIQIPEIKHQSGKVRESFILSEKKRAIVVTDRLSAFDMILGTVPFKGQVLNKIAAWWFQKLSAINIPHHFISSPQANISIVKNAQPLPVEVVVRGFLTGTTKTSAWWAYQNNNKEICGIKMPENMKKNQAFNTAIITPTTKPAAGSGEHDRPIKRAEIIEEKLVSEEIYSQMEEIALKTFAFGQKEAAKQGLILVDTKYEFGLDQNGNVMLIDEVHTPDSSRYWIKETYQTQFNANQEPQMLDKEFIRTKLVEKGIDISADPETYDGSKFFTDDLRVLASVKYAQLFETMTGQEFTPETGNLTQKVTEIITDMAKED